MKIIRGLLISLFFISFSFPLSLQLTIEDIPEGVAQYVIGSLIGLGPKFAGIRPSTTGIYVFENIPDGSIFMIKMLKAGCVDTYWGPYLISSESADETGIVKESRAIFSHNVYNNLQESPAPKHQLGKATIVGSVKIKMDKEYKGVGGVVINAKYLDNNESIPSSQIKYLNDNLNPGNYSSTQNNGFYCIYNVDPERPILLTGTKEGCIFTQVIQFGYPDIGYPHCVSVWELEQVSNYISVSGVVKDLLNEKKLSQANVLILGTNLSSQTNNNGEFNLNNVPPKSQGIFKVSKQDCKDLYIFKYLGMRNEKDIELFTISNAIYKQILPISHISGKGDVWVNVGTSGVSVKLFEILGPLVDLSGKIYYMDENGNFKQSSSTSSKGVFVILNLDPGIYFLRPVHENMDFPSTILFVFSEGISYVKLKPQISQKTKSSQ